MGWLDQLVGEPRWPARRPIGAALPPAQTPLHLPLLRDSVYGGVDGQLRRATQAMRGLGVSEFGHHDAPLYWQALGPRNRWPTELPAAGNVRVGFERDILQPRLDAARTVAQELEFHLPQFRGLTSKIHYEPWHHLLGKYDGGVTDMGSGQIRLASRAFESPRRLAQVVMHEARHYQQWRDFGPTSQYNRPNTLADADAYLFDLEHRNLTQLSRGDLAFTVGRFRRLCDLDDRLAAGQRIEPAWGVTEMMDRVRRADLELRYSGIEPALRRELAGSSYTPLWSLMRPTFSYQPLRPLAEAHRPSFLQELSRGLR